ncbi:MAG: HEPN domain-containing protein, partial [Myxococcota bacterium]|nr:HEPN domain-containing protein [Myxococcota bacterium]
HDLKATPPLLADVVFHCRQAAEKSLKGFLAWHDRPFRKTHDLVAVGQACVNLDASLEALLRSAAPLTEYAWRYRYPGDPEDPSAAEAESALTVARQVNDAILARLPHEVMP